LFYRKGGGVDLVANEYAPEGRKTVRLQHPRTST